MIATTQQITQDRVPTLLGGSDRHPLGEDTWPANPRAGLNTHHATIDVCI